MLKACSLETQLLVQTHTKGKNTRENRRDADKDTSQEFFFFLRPCLRLVVFF